MFLFFYKNFIAAWGIKPHAIERGLCYYCIVFSASKFTKHLNKKQNPLTQKHKRVK